MRSEDLPTIDMRGCYAFFTIINTRLVVKSILEMMELSLFQVIFLLTIMLNNSFTRILEFKFPLGPSNFF